MKKGQWEPASRRFSSDYRTDCLDCHEPAGSQDLIYVQGYPVLKR